MIYGKQRLQALKEQRELLEKKEVAFYAETVRAWFSTSMEHDKSLLTLSAGGIGLLVTLLTKFELPSSTLRMFYVAAILAFCTCLVCVLIIFKRNREHLVDIIHSDATEDQTLKKLDAGALWSFGLGIFFSSLIGIFAAFSADSRVGSVPVSIVASDSVLLSASSSASETEIGCCPPKEKTMTIKKLQTGKPSGTTMAQDSVNNASKLQVQRDKIKSSVDGANRLKPPTPAGSGTTKIKGD